MTKRLIYIIIGVALLAACHYDENISVCPVSVQMVYPEATVTPHAGTRIELKDQWATVFADTTDAQGTARFVLPPGIYEATATETYTDPHPDEGYAWRYSINGVRSRIVVARDSANDVRLEVQVTRRRIIY